MTRIQEIDTQIAELKEKLNNVVGTETEVYTRIVGYYRSVKNWNAGKKDEYKRRVLFDPNIKHNQDMQGKVYNIACNETLTNNENSIGPVAECREVPSEGDKIEANVDKCQHEITKYFYRQTCPNCPVAKKWLEDNGIDYQAIDVDTQEGFKLAGEYQIYSTPTVVMNGDKFTSVQQLTDLVLV